MATHVRSIEQSRPQAGAAAAPIDRRRALGSLAAAGAAFLAVPKIARAADLDADLLALHGPIEAARRELDDVLDALRDAEVAARRGVPERPIAPDMDPATRRAVDEFGERMRAIREQGPSAEQIAYDEALRQWEEDKARAQAESGVDAAYAAEIAALDAVGQLRDRIVETPAKTFAGLIFKAKYAAKDDYDEEVMASIVKDLLAMSENA